MDIPDKKMTERKGKSSKRYFLLTINNHSYTNESVERNSGTHVQRGRIPTQEIGVST